MKNIATVLVALVLLFQITSCIKPDPCAKVACYNGQCFNGTCSCDLGYVGAKCETAENVKFAGHYYGAANCSGSNTSMDINVYVQPDPLKIGLDLGFIVIGSISGNNIVMAPQTSGLERVSGLGQINGNQMVLTIYLTDLSTGDVTQCSFVGSK